MLIKLAVFLVMTLALCACVGAPPAPSCAGPVRLLNQDERVAELRERPVTPTLAPAPKQEKETFPTNLTKPVKELNNGSYRK